MLSDLRYALRTLRQNPGFALVAIVSLALGIGANAAIFSLADASLLRPLSVPHPSQLITVQSHMRGEGNSMLASFLGLSYPDFTDLKDRSKSFAGLTGARFVPFGLAREKGALPQAKFGALVTADFFRVLDVHPALGRGFRPEEDQVAGRDAVVVLSYDLWKNEFAASPGILGKTIYLNGIDFTVVGVAPEEFTGPDVFVRPALYAPLAMGPRLTGDTQERMLRQRGDRSLEIKGRLKPGVSLGQAAAEAQVIAQQLAQSYPDTNRNTSLAVDTDVQGRMKQQPSNLASMGFMLVLAGIVLLIACGNVMNLMLSRARARSREIAVRLALGAGRGRLLRQLLVESLVIAVLGGAAGLLVTQAGVGFLSQIRVPGDIPVVIDVRLDARVLLFAFFASVASAIVFGLVPAWQSTKTNLVKSLKLGKSDNGKRRFLGRNALVIGQVAGSMVLLVFASQSYRGARILLSSPPGYRTDHVLTASFDPTLTRYTPAQTRQFYKQLLDKARLQNGVESAALTEGLPLLPWNWTMNQVIPEGFQLAPHTESVNVFGVAVTDGYFASLGVPLVEGRDFRAEDTADSPRVAIVNEQFARKYYPQQNPIGKRFRLQGRRGPMVQIVGLARQSTYLFPIEPPTEFLYVPLSQNPHSGMTLLLHTAGDPTGFAAPLRDLVRSLDAGQPIIGIRTMQEVFDQRGRDTLNLVIQSMAAMGILGLTLALVGLYGLMTYSVGLRQREIGIRMAVGADSAGVLRMVLKQGMVLGGSGVALGALLSLMANHVLTSGMGARSFSMPLLALVVIGLLAAAGLGAYVPARRASLLDPNIVLRQE